MEKEKTNKEFNYMMLDRLRCDCEYFLGYGNGNEKSLWAGNIKDQIAEMKKIYDLLPEKPEWLSLEEINKYEAEMLKRKETTLPQINKITINEFGERQIDTYPQENVCPMCNSHKIEYTTYPVDEGGFSNHCVCEDCKTEWYECYDLIFAGNFNIIDKDGKEYSNLET